MPRYYMAPYKAGGELHPARWEIFDREYSSEVAVAQASEALMAERIVKALNAGE